MLSLLRSERLFASLVLVLLVVALAALNPSLAQAVSYTWNVASGNWDQAGNWTPGGGPPGSGAGDDGTIGANTATANAQLGNSANILVNGTGTVIFDNLATSATGGTFDVDSGGRLQWLGTSTGTTAVTLLDGATFGKAQLNVLAVSSDDLTIDSNATATASLIYATVSRTSLGLRHEGSLIGDNTTTLVVNPSSTSTSRRGALVLQPSVANTGFEGDVELAGTGAIKGTLVLSGTGALSDVGAISFGTGGQLRISNATDPLPSAYALTVPVGGRMEWERTQTYTGTVPTITFQDGATLGREEDTNVQGVAQAAIVIDPNATVTASQIAATVSRSTLGLRLTGSLTGDSTTTLVVDPSSTSTSRRGALAIAPSTANTGFDGVVELKGTSNVRGTLVLSGTGALSDVSSLTIEDGGMLRFSNATDPLPSGFAITVPNGGRMEWERTQTYAGTPPTITFEDGSEFGREEDTNVAGFSDSNIVIDSGATVTATRIASTVVRTDLDLTLRGSLSGDSTSTIHFTVPSSGNLFGPLTLDPSSANAFAGTFEVAGDTVTRQAALVLDGTGPLANAKLLDIQEFGTVQVDQAGAADNMQEIRIRSGGTLQFRNASGSTLDGTTLTGTGLVRSETTNTSVLVPQATRSLTFTNSTVSPGQSAGDLTIEASLTTFDLGSILEMEIGTFDNDTLIVTGDLQLNAGSTLELLALPDLTSGIYTIATYSGTLSGEFGTIGDNFGSTFLLGEINYGTLSNSLITVEIFEIPEPSSALLLGLGLLGMSSIRHRRRRTQKSY